MIDAHLRMVPGLAEDLERVEGLLWELGGDPLKREPLSSILETVIGLKGKRLRPILILLAGRLGPDFEAGRESLRRTATAVELIHAASLIHDDIIDDSPLRRGKPTVQARFGKDMAVYAGDFLLSRILYHLMDHSFVDGGKILAKSMCDMCCGEITQYAAQFHTETDENAYFTSILGKTAALFSASCRLGAMAAGCGAEEVRAMGEFGRDLGVLFQLRDDLLDHEATEEDAGKPVHSDFKHGIYTLPVLHTFRRRETGAELRELALLVQNGDHDGALCRRMEELVTQAEGVEYTRRVMSEYGSRALALLAGFPQGRAKQALMGLTGHLTGR